jgi:nondiscriminating aspartyl-tRNA synthetase
MARQLIAELEKSPSEAVTLKGWIRRIRETKSTTFIVLQDCSGIIQIVAEPAKVKELGLRAESAVLIVGQSRIDQRAPGGVEIDCDEIEVLNPAAEVLPFTSTSRLEEISPDLAINSRPLALRTDRGGTIFRIEAALAEEFRAALRRRRFTEIFTSKIVASATEGGTNLFAIKYFDRAAYLAQSPQFYKEHAVAGMERVFETGHVYRAEPHASSRHLCEYLSLDLEMGFIDGFDDIIELERAVMTEAFATIRERFAISLAQFDSYLPSLATAPTWTFEECLDRLRKAHRRADLIRLRSGNFAKSRITKPEWQRCSSPSFRSAAGPSIRIRRAMVCMRRASICCCAGSKLPLAVSACIAAPISRRPCVRAASRPRRSSRI